MLKVNSKIAVIGIGWEERKGGKKKVLKPTNYNQNKNPQL